MLSAKRLIEMARKWQKMAGRKRKRISYQRRKEEDDEIDNSLQKGHFVVYSVDNKRFVVPLKYLSRKVFKELLKWSEEEFGLQSNGPIRLPCDGVLLEYVMCLVQERVPEDVEKALITSIAACHNEASSSSSSSSSHSHDLRQTHGGAIIYGF